MYSLTILYYIKYNFLKYHNKVALDYKFIYLINTRNTTAMSHLKIINTSQGHVNKYEAAMLP
jgi:hypothetical protein